MRVCDLTIFYHKQSGGVRTYIHEKIRYLARHRNSDAHLVIVPGEQDLEARHKRSRMQFLKGPVVPFARPYRIILHPLQAYRLLLSFRPDIIEVGCPYIFPWIAFLVRRCTRQGGGARKASGEPGRAAGWSVSITATFQAPTCACTTSCWGRSRRPCCGSWLSDMCALSTGGWT